jgi:hypothetical protein
MLCRLDVSGAATNGILSQALRYQALSPDFVFKNKTTFFCLRGASRLTQLSAMHDYSTVEYLQISHSRVAPSEDGFELGSDEDLMSTIG